MPKETNISLPKTPTIIGIISSLIGHPIKNILFRWNWKSAFLSAMIRSSIYLFTYLVSKEGLKAAIGAMIVEFLVRSFTAGISGSLIQSFRKAQPIWAATLIAVILIPSLSHTIEYFNHYLHEFAVSRIYSTPMIEGARKSSFYFSIVFSIISVVFNLFAARRGVLLIGKDEGQQSLWKDLKQMPKITVEFILYPFIRLRQNIAIYRKRKELHLSENPKNFANREL